MSLSLNEYLSPEHNSNITSHRVNTVISNVRKHLDENWAFVLDLKLDEVDLS